MPDATKGQDNLRSLNDRALKQLDAVAQAQTQLQNAYRELGRIRLEAGGSVRAFHRAIDTVMSW